MWDRPLIKRPEGTKFRTLLSIDGGGVRGIIPVMVLIELENAIKEHIFENRDTLVPEDVRDSITSVNDFDINLVDYFNLVAGTSIGSWIACYIASRGSGMKPFLSQPDIVQTYGNIRPGNMAAVLMSFGAIDADVFQTSTTFPRLRSFFAPPFASDGMKTVLATFFGETTMEDLETDCLITAYDLRRNAACSFLRKLGEEEKNCLVRTAVRHEARTPEDAAKSPWTPDLAFIKGQNYRLRDITLASSALPLAFAPARITAVGEKDPEELVLVDGGVVARNPTLQALTYIPSTIDSGDVRDVAILSLGCGLVDLTDDLDPNPGSLWWLDSGHLLDAYGNGASEYIQAAMDYWLYGHLKLPYGQYVRLQVSAAANTDTGRALAAWNTTEAGAALQQIGQDLAQNNLSEIKRFVSDYIFASTS